MVTMDAFHNDSFCNSSNNGNICLFFQESGQITGFWSKFSRSIKNTQGWYFMKLIYIFIFIILLDTTLAVTPQNVSLEKGMEWVKLEWNDINWTSNETIGGTITGSGSADYICKFFDNNTITDSIMYENGSYIYLNNSRVCTQNNGLCADGSGHIIQNEGTPLTTRPKLNFVGELVEVTDDAGNNATKVT